MTKDIWKHKYAEAESSRKLLKKQNSELSKKLEKARNLNQKILKNITDLADERDVFKKQNAELLDALKEVSRIMQSDLLGEGGDITAICEEAIQKAESVFDSINVSDGIKNKVDNRFDDLDQKAEEK